MAKELNRRTFIGAGAAGLALLASGAKAAAAFSFTENWLSAMNSGSEENVAQWARGAVSAAGLRRRPSDQWGRWLVQQSAASGPLSIIRSTPMGSNILVELRGTRLSGIRRVEIRADRDEPDKIFDLRPYLQPAKYAEPIEETSTPSALGAAIARRVAHAVRNDDFSGSVQVTASGGTVIFQQSVGWADKALGRRITANTPINIGSADKSFTAILIGQMVEAGDLTFDTPLLTILPDYPAPDAVRGTTIHHLLTHSAGLGEPAGGILSYTRSPYQRVTDLLPALASIPPRFSAGARAEYSNEGYVVLGAIIERVGKKPYWDMLSERVYGPAGMTHSGHLTRPEAHEIAALGYYFEVGDLLLTHGRVSNGAQAPWRGNSCGGGYATPADVARYFEALLGGRLVSNGMVRTMTAQAAEPYPGMGYGMGFARDRIGDTLFIGHSGGGSGVGIGVGLRTDVATGTSIAVLGNYDLQYAAALTQDLMRLVAKSS